MMSRAVPTKTPPRPKKLFKHGRMDVNRPRARWRAVSTEAEDGGRSPSFSTLPRNIDARPVMTQRSCEARSRHASFRWRPRRLLRIDYTMMTQSISLNSQMLPKLQRSRNDIGRVFV